MTWYADQGNVTMVCSGEHVRAVGWLGKGHSFPTGRVIPEFLERLQDFVALNLAGVRPLGFGIFMGVHKCEFCGKFESSGNVGVPDGEVLWIAPEMIAHYVEVHSYVPPAQFVDAFLRCPPPGSEAYRRLALPFEKLNRRK